MRSKGVGTGSLSTDKMPEESSAAKATSVNATPIAKETVEKSAKATKSSKTSSLAKAAASDKPVPEELF